MEVITTVDQLPALAEKLAATNEIGLDFETTSFSPIEKAPLHFDKMKVVGWGFGFPDGEATYLPVAHQVGENLPFEEALTLLKRVLEDQTKIVWAHNAKFEATVSRVLRIDTKCEWRCSMLAQWILQKGLPGKSGHKLKPAAQAYLGHKMIEWEEVVPKKSRAHMVAPSTLGPYCADDALQSLRLGKLFSDEIEELSMTRVFLELENPVATEVLPHMDEVGFAIDRGVLRDMADSFQKEMHSLAFEFKTLTGIDIGKDAQISVMMYDTMKWWPVRDHFRRGKSGRVSVDATHRAMVKELLEEGSPGYQAIEFKDRYARLSKIVSTYTHSLIKKADQFSDGRLRSSWLQHGTQTGRFASREPNLQNIPIRTPEGSRVREAFVSEEGWNLYDRDYSGADLRVFAHLCHDENMTQAFLNNEDLHQKTANACNVPRPAGKVANLGLIYGMGPGTLARGIGAPLHASKRLWKSWHETYPRVRRYHNRQFDYLRKHGYVRTLTNRIRYIDGIDSSQAGKNFRAQHEAVNTPAQGSVADIIKIAMRNLVREWRDRGVLFDIYTGEGKAKLLSQVHDELIVELRDDFKEEGAADVQRCMEKAVELRVPLITEGGFGKNWLKAH